MPQVGLEHGAGLGVPSLPRAQPEPLAVDVLSHFCSLLWVCCSCLVGTLACSHPTTLKVQLSAHSLVRLRLKLRRWSQAGAVPGLPEGLCSR